MRQLFYRVDRGAIQLQPYLSFYDFWFLSLFVFLSCFHFSLLCLLLMRVCFAFSFLFHSYFFHFLKILFTHSYFCLLFSPSLFCVLSFFFHNSFIILFSKKKRKNFNFSILSFWITLSFLSPHSLKIMSVTNLFII